VHFRQPVVLILLLERNKDRVALRRGATPYGLPDLHPHPEFALGFSKQAQACKFYVCHFAKVVGSQFE